MDDMEMEAKGRRTMGHLNEAAISAHEAEKGNIPQNIQLPSTELIKAKLQEAGLADMPSYKPTEESETPLGSVDRTKVSLGDSERTTDSERFIRDQWGTEGTMIKIVESIKEGTRPLNIYNLVIKESTIPPKRIVAARCFSSVLKLKQHSFIEVCKDPETLEITDIVLGPVFKH